jgi:hypothetical protein
MHAFVDESIRRRYLLCAAMVRPENLDDSRRELRMMLLPGQRRLHFSQESAPRRKALLSRMSRMNVQAAIYECAGKEAGARRAGIRLVVQDLVAIGARRLVVESREGRDRVDRRTIRAALFDAGAIDRLGYEHMRPSEEPLLWVADAVAWAYGAGQTWRRRVGGIVEVVTRVVP